VSPPLFPDITLILPAYNEAGRIANTIAESLAYFQSTGRTCEIIVAADGTDGTREIAAALAATNPALRVIGHPERLGKGRGIREAVALATGNIIGFADADNKVPIGEYSLIEPAFCQHADVVIGSRALASSVIDRPQPWYRRVGSRAFGFFMQTVVGLPHIHDTQCGFKFFRREAAKAIFARQVIDGYMFDVEILAIATRLGMHIVEVPIRWHDDGDSRLSLIAGNLRNVRDIFRIGITHRFSPKLSPKPSSAALLIALAFIFSACHKPPPEKLYQMRGAIVSIDIPSKIAVIHNEKIEGWMESMTMEFPVHDPALLKGLAPGDHIIATVHVNDELAFWIDNLKKQ
jgi:dolichyl-phosphate beta-glucosyltransferase